MGLIKESSLQLPVWVTLEEVLMLVECSISPEADAVCCGSVWKILQWIGEFLEYFSGTNMGNI